MKHCSRSATRCRSYLEARGPEKILIPNHPLIGHYHISDEVVYDADAR
jgi:hypothetical protein